MNKGGLQNRAGELIKELDELLLEIAPKRKTQARDKYQYEHAQNTMEDLQEFLVHTMQIDTNFDWENPNPILTTEGKPMDQFEAQYRMRLINFSIQNAPEFIEAMNTRDMLKDAYYATEGEVITLMEKIGVKKAQLAAVTGLVRLADES